jgi:DNA-directed RNA polymerase specialized sigma24 family protein
MVDRPLHAARSITPAGFAYLLARLDADPGRAAMEYERLRLTLVKFFDWRGAWDPDACADEALDRLVARLEGNTEVVDVRRYAHGIARLVLLERLRSQALAPRDDESKLADMAAPPHEGADPRRECFERCLAALPPDGRTLVLEYYDGTGQTKIQNRRRVAQSIGVSENALRSRVQRLRDRLETCTRTCAAMAEARGLDASLRHVFALSDTTEMKGTNES